MTHPPQPGRWGDGSNVSRITAKEHDLRHSAATILLAAGVPERVVMEILGHSTLAMVKRYQHVLPGLTIAAAERVDAVMGR